MVHGWDAYSVHEEVILAKKPCFVRFGSGWIPWGPDAMNPARGLARIREELEAAGRSAEGFQVSSYIPIALDTLGGVDIDKTMAAVPGMVEAGITDLRATVSLPTELQAATDFLSPLVASFRAAVGRPLS